MKNLYFYLEQLHFKNALFLHGLDSEPTSDQRKNMFKKYNINIDSPHVDYRKEYEKDEGESAFKHLVQIAKNKDLIIGTSFGGYLAYHIALAVNKKCLLINPALDRSITKTVIKDFKMNYKKHNPHISVFFGSEDNVIPKEKTLSYLRSRHDKFDYKIIEGFGHRVPNAFLELILISYSSN